jgi:hypothetical protein
VVVNRRQTCRVFKACAWPTGCINRAPTCSSTPTLTAALHAGMMILGPSYPSLTSPASLPWSITEFQPASTMDHGHTCGSPERFSKKTVSNQKTTMAFLHLELGSSSFRSYVGFNLIVSRWMRHEVEVARKSKSEKATMSRMERRGEGKSRDKLRNTHAETSNVSFVSFLKVSRSLENYWKFERNPRNR